jgi:2-iminobutanoate/2-iminopropanoate deaminase
VTDKKEISSNSAPKAIGIYSQAIQSHNLIFVSGQIPIDPSNGALISEEFKEQAHQVMKNLVAIAHESKLNINDYLKFTVYLTDLANFSLLNQVMGSYLKKPYPARAAIEVSGLPMGAKIEIEGVLTIK